MTRDILQSLRDATRPVRAVEVVADQVRVVVVVDPVVRRHQVPERGVDRPRQLVERDPPVPLVIVGPARHRARAVAGATDGIQARALVADRAVDVGVHEVLARTGHAPHGAAELVEARRVRGVEDERRPDAALQARPSQRVRVGLRERDVLGLHVSDDGGLDDRAVARLADVDHHGLGGSADVDLLAMDRERLPRAEMLGGGAVLVQALDVEVLHVARDVRDAPRVVRGRAQQDAGRERERHAARLVSRSAEVHLDPRAGLDREQVRVVREQGLPGGGARPGHDPVVRTLALRAGEVVEQTPAERARRDMRQVGRERGQERAHGVGSQPLADRGAEELLVPVAGEPPRQVHERRRPRAGIVGGDARGHVQQRVLDRGRRHLRDPRRASLAEPRVHRLRDVVPSGGERRARAVEADRPREPVVLERPVGEDLGQAAARGAEQQVELEQAFAGRDEALREPQIVERRGADVRHAPAVAEDLDRLGETRRGQLAVLGQERRGGDLAELFDEVAHACGSLPVAGFGERLARVAEPALVQPGVHAAAFQQLGVRPLFDQPAGVQDQHAVGVLGRRQPVRDRDHGPSRRQAAQRLGGAALGGRIHRARGLVQDQQPGLVDLRARQRHELALADGQRLPALADRRVQPLRAATPPSRSGPAPRTRSRRPGRSPTACRTARSRGRSCRTGTRPAGPCGSRSAATSATRRADPRRRPGCAPTPGRRAGRAASRTWSSRRPSGRRSPRASRVRPRPRCRAAPDRPRGRRSPARSCGPGSVPPGARRRARARRSRSAGRAP